MTIQLVALTSINANAGTALEKYLSVVGPLMQSANARIVHRFELLDCINGTSEIQYVTLVEYPDEAAIKKVFDSEEYKSLDSVKSKAFSRYQVNKVAPM